MIRKIIQVKPRSDYKVYVYFASGEVKLYDVAPLIKKGGIFNQISDLDIFLNKCTVMNGTLAWDIAGNFDKFKCIDIDPETIYSEGKKVKDPLSDEGVA